MEFSTVTAQQLKDLLFDLSVIDRSDLVERFHPETIDKDLVKLAIESKTKRLLTSLQKPDLNGLSV